MRALILVVFLPIAACSPGLKLKHQSHDAHKQCDDTRLSTIQDNLEIPRVSKGVVCADSV